MTKSDAIDNILVLIIKIAWVLVSISILKGIMLKFPMNKYNEQTFILRSLYTFYIGVERIKRQNF